MRNGKSGFTLVELLVVIAIIGTLTAIILPAVNSARNAARQTECSNNVRQLASAMQIYASSKSTLPGYVTTVKNSNGALVADFVYSILPMLEQTVLREEIDQLVEQNQVQDNDSDGYMDLASTEGEIKILSCPSNPPAPGKFAPSYIANGGHLDLVLRDQTGKPLSDKPNGALSLSLDNETLGIIPTNLQPQPYQITLDYISSNDGTSQTAIVSENVRFTTEDGGGWLPRFVTASFNVQTVEKPRTMWWHAEVDSEAIPPSSNISVKNQSFTSSPNMFPGFISEEVVPVDLATTQQRSAPFSHHAGGFLVGFADGHTQFISDGISYRVYAKLLTSNGGSSAASYRQPPSFVGKYYQDTALTATDMNQ